MAYTRRTAITEECMDNAIASIALTGRYITAIGILNTTHTNFNNWRKKEPALKQRVERALQQHYKNNDIAKKELANDAAAEMLRHGRITSIHTEVESVDPQTGEIVKLRSERIKREGPPLALIERYLGHSNAELELMDALVENGFLSPERLDEVHQAILDFRETVRGAIDHKPSEARAEKIEIPQSELRTEATKALREILSGTIERNQAIEVSVQKIED